MMKNLSPSDTSASFRRSAADAADAAESSITPDVFLHEKDMERASALAPTLSFLGLLMVAGLMGNLIVFLVYYKKTRSSTANCYILALSVCDLLSSGIALPTDIWEIVINSTFYIGWACKMIRSIRVFLITLSIGIVVSVAVDRQRSICNMRPCRSYSLRSVYTALTICTSISLLLSAPYAVLTGNRTQPFRNSNITGVRCAVSDKYYGTMFHYTYHIILSVLFCICLLIIILSYVRIALHLLRHRQLQTAMIGATGNSEKCEDSKNNETENPDKIEQEETVRNDDGRKWNSGEFSKKSLRTEISILSLPDVVGEACTIMSTRRKSSLASVRSIRESWTGSERSSFIVSEQISRTSTRTNFMLFILTVIFIVSSVPFLALVTAEAKLPDLCAGLNINVEILFKRSFFVHCAVNPMIYSFCSANFRQETRRLFRCQTP